MGLKDIKLWENNLPDADLVSSIVDLSNEGLPTLTPYLLKGEKLRPAIIVCPGGEFTSTHKHVTTKTPPAFLWVTATDDFNFQRQNLNFAQALSEQNLSFELHIFSKGPHGLGLGKDEPAVAIWPKLCENWLQELWSTSFK